MFLYFLFKLSRATSEMYFYRKNRVWTYFSIWKNHNMVPFLLSDTMPDFPVSFWRAEALSYLLIPNISWELSTWLAHSKCVKNQTGPTSLFTVFQYSLGIFPLTFMLPWFFQPEKDFILFSFSLPISTQSVVKDELKYRLTPKGGHPNCFWPSTGGTHSSFRK